MFKFTILLDVIRFYWKVSTGSGCAKFVIRYGYGYMYGRYYVIAISRDPNVVVDTTHTHTHHIVSVGCLDDPFEHIVYIYIYLYLWP